MIRDLLSVSLLLMVWFQNTTDWAAVDLIYAKLKVSFGRFDASIPASAF